MPSLPPPVWAELFYDGAFNSITGDLHVRAPVSVTRGRSGERDSAGPSQGAMTLLNTGAKFSRRNPNSELYGQIGLNTPIRYGYDGVGSVWAVATGAATSYLSTPSSASYNITGDLDVRVEVASESWTSENSNIANRYDATTNERGWSLRVSASGVPQLFWSTDGTTSPSVSATAYLPAHAGQRIALRATLDVANAAGVYEVRFYTGLDAGSGDEDTWHLLGDPVIGSTSTSVNNPSLPVRFGALPTSANPGLEGRLYRLQLRDGIGGTVLLDVDTSLAAVGAGSFQDAGGHTWTANQVTFTRRHVRFHGEVPDWTPLRDKSGNFKTVSISPAGISRRLSSGEKLLRSPLFREMSNRARQNIVAYWPLEDSSDALSLASGLVGGRTGKFSGDVSLAADSTSWLSSDPLPTIRAGKVTLPVLAYTDTGQMSMRFLLAVPSTGVTTNGVMARLTTTGTVRVWELGIRTDGTLRVTAYDSDGAVLDDDIIAFTVNGSTVAVTFEVSVSGSTITRRLVTTPYTPGLTINTLIQPTASTGTLTGTSVGRITSLQLGDGTADLGGITVGHPAIANDLNGYANTGSATIGWNGESARARLLRLAAEEEVPLSVAMDDGARPQMGVQQSSTFLDLIRQVETVDQGVLFERRDGIELAYRGASTLLNQEPVLTLDFEDGLFDDIRPKDDDRAAFNAMTAKRIGGSEFTYELTEGANSIQDPPDGIGYYGTSVDLSLASDDDLPDQAAWRVHVATVDEMRYPTITLNLANSRVYALFDDIMRVDVGDKIRLTNLPADYSVDDVDLLVWGPSEAPGPDNWPVTFTCVPAEPWSAGIIASLFYGRADTAGCELISDYSDSATSMLVFTTAQVPWINAAPVRNTNSGFDSGITGWSAFGGASLAWDATRGRPGSLTLGCLQLTTSGASTPRAEGARTAVEPNRPYILSGWLRADSTLGTTASVSVNWYTALSGGSFITTSSVTLTLTAGVWTYFQGTVTSPATALGGGVLTSLGGTPSTGLVWRADDLELRDYVANTFANDFPMELRAGGEVMRATACASAFYDSLSRTVAPGGWGTSDSGAAYSTGGGTGTDFSVGSGYGIHTMTSVSAARRTYVGYNYPELDYYGSIAVSAIATGGSIFGALTGRYQDVSNVYLAMAEFTTASTLILSLRKRVAGAETTLASFTPGITYSAGTFYRIRLQIIGTTLKAKIWAASSLEPGPWQIVATDSSLNTPVFLGVYSILAGANTNVSPQVRYDNLELANPQTFTMTRSVNGVVKAQSAGEDIRLATPVYVAP
ncbi:hypothetical protein AQI96_12875 [Streptomyces canus]|nr:hypothetical protein AQI96_12875 [Streptomyces canus]